MHNKIKLLLIFLFSLITYLQAESPHPVPTPFINSVNIITGEYKGTPPPLLQQEYYVAGHNDVEGVSIHLTKCDFRIGRVKMQKVQQEDQSWRTIARFFYFPDYTEIIQASHKSLYRYSKSQLITTIEHYSSSSNLDALYRKEKLFWNENTSPPQLISRVLEDAQGHATVCCTFHYNPQGQLIKETLYGNLSGNCIAPLLIQSNGYPVKNEIESYSTAYTYSVKNPHLIAKQCEDNGAMTVYHYTPMTHQCTAKLIGSLEGLVARYFYFYDDQGFLSQTLIDDGQGEDWQNLAGATYRQIIKMQARQQEPAIGQPLVTESKYLDLQTGKEILLERIEHTYSPTGELTQQDFYDSQNVWRYDLKMKYDERGKLIAKIDSRGQTDEPAKEPVKYRYNNLKQRIGLIDHYGNETRYVYDHFGRLIETIYPEVLDEQEHLIHPSTRQEYDISDRVIKQYDATGALTQTFYNVRGKPTRIVYPDGSFESFVYFLDGNLKEKREKNGIKILFKRDSLGRILHSEEYSATGNLIQQLTYHYRSGQLVSITDGQIFTACFQYDGANRQIGSRRQTKDGIQRLEWSYDTDGQKTHVREWFGPEEQDFIIKIQESEVSQKGMKIQFQDAAGEIQKCIQVPNSNETNKHNLVFTQDLVSLNNRNQYVRQQERIASDGKRELITYDALNRIESIVKLDGFGNRLTDCQLRYDANGNLTSERHLILVKGSPTRSFVIAKVYDALNRVICISEGLGSPQQKQTYYQYNDSGQLETILKPNGTILFHTYDDQGHLATFLASDHSFAYHYTYDNQGNLTCIHDCIHHTSLIRHYNHLGQLIEEQLSPQLILKNSYDLAGRRISLTLPDQSSVAYHYKGLLLKSIERLSCKGESLYQHGYQYDPISHQLANSQLIGRAGTLTYETQGGYLSKISSPWWEQTIAQDPQDSNQTLTHITTQDLAGQSNQFFSYTDDNQLASETGYFNYHYTYDSLYNRLTVNGQDWQTNEFNQLMKTPDAEYEYDINGNLIHKRENAGLWHYYYDALNRLTRVEKEKEEAIEYRYDAFHRRLSELCYDWDSLKQGWALKDQYFFLYDSNKEIGKLDQQGHITELRVLGQGRGAEIGAAIALELEGTLYAPIHDYQGSVRCLIDVDKQSVAEFYRYSAYGLEEIFDSQGVVSTHSITGNPWRFCSKREDALTHFLFYGKRYYDPQIGRWTTPDPLLSYDTPNLYAFVRNNPLSYSDLYGLFSIDIGWNQIVEYGRRYMRRIFFATDDFYKGLCAELKIPLETRVAFERIGHEMLGESMFLLMGYHFEETEIGTYGQKEMHDKVRVTFINGILTTQSHLIGNLELISQSHGGVNVHYIFRPTEGWVWDISRGLMIKTAFALGFRSCHAHLLAEMWRSLIADMGGTKGDGVIIHYAHSLGGSDTDRARELLTPEEQKMIRVISFGSATMIRNEGFANVVNYVSLNDGVSYLDPMGRTRNLLDPNCNIIFKHKLEWVPLCDHALNGITYKPIIEELGEQFILKFTSD